MKERYKPLDKRIKYRIVLDTETCPIDKNIEGVMAENMLVYDCGWAVVDKRGNVYEKRSFLNRDIFIGEKDRMNSAYYSDKIPNYWKDIHENKRKMAHFDTISRILKEDCRKYNVDEIYCHNARFDYVSLIKTAEWLDEKPFFPKNITICDTLKMSRDVLGKMPTYKRFCERNGFMTNHKTPRPRMTAEVIYRYITNDIDFIEEHTGLEDVMIEKEILAYCYKQHKKMRKKLFED